MDVSWLLLLRAIHIAAAAVWFGTVVFSTFFLAPTLKDAGEGAKGFMAAVNKRGGFGRFMGPIGATTLLSGLLLYWQLGYLRTPFATTSHTLLTLGAVIALAGWIFALVANGPLQKRLVALGSAGGPPTAEMMQLQASIASRGRAFGIVIMAAFALMVLRGVVS